MWILPDVSTNSKTVTEWVRNKHISYNFDLEDRFIRNGLFLLPVLPYLGVVQIDFDTEYILEDERVKLGPLRPEDYTFMLRYALEEPDLWLYSVQAAAGPLAMKKYLEQALDGRTRGYAYPFAVIDKKDNSFAGSTRFYDIQPHNGSLLLGYTWYGRAYQGSGLNRHCKYLLLHLAFDRLGAERVEFRADARNSRSIAAMKSLGCTPEGVLRSHMPGADGLRRDSALFSILRDEWNSRLQKELYRKCYPS